MCSTYPESRVQAEGRLVTTISRSGGVGLGYLMPDGAVYASAGNGWFYAACGSTGGLDYYIDDGGLHYYRRVREITGYRVR
jgi:hypothetical protein